jgi:hypothetical protein
MALLLFFFLREFAYHATCFSTPKRTSAANSNAMATAQPSAERTAFFSTALARFDLPCFDFEQFDPEPFDLPSACPSVIGYPSRLCRKRKTHSRSGEWVREVS